MTARIFIKLILTVLGVLAVALTAVSLLVTPRIRDSFVATLERELTARAHTLSLALPREQPEFAALARAAQARVTWIASDGRVLGDSQADPPAAGNLRETPLVRAVLAGRAGSSHTGFISAAVPAPSGSALLLSIPAPEVDAQVAVIRNGVLLATTLAFLPAALLAAGFARYVSGKLGRIIEYARELAEGNFRARLKGSSRGELGLLSAKLNETSEKLEFMMDRLESEHAELEKLERVRKDFVINVSHELRTPLASIQGYTETLLDGAVHEPENNIKFLNIIRQNTERLTRLTADLLILSRIELGQQKFKFASYYVNRLLTDDIDAMRPIASRKRIELVLEPAAPTAEVFCDAEAVHQVLSNLLDNAIKYTPEGGKVIVGARPADHDRIEFFVRDTGLGIPAEDLARLFERFYRVDKARSRALGGTGLGLAIVKHLTRAQGGDVRVESQEGKGSTFLFTLPVQDLGLSESGAVQKELTVQ